MRNFAPDPDRTVPIYPAVTRWVINHRAPRTVDTRATWTIIAIVTGSLLILSSLLALCALFVLSTLT